MIESLIVFVFLNEKFFFNFEKFNYLVFLCVVKVLYIFFNVLIWIVNFVSNFFLLRDDEVDLNEVCF